MTDGQIFALAYLAFYLMECVRWVPIRAWLFQGYAKRAWSGAQPWSVFRTRSGGGVLLWPLPLKPHVVTANWPCVPHEEGLHVSNDENGTIHRIPWDQVKARAEGPMLNVAKGIAVRCVNPASATSWAENVTLWKGQTQPEREANFAEKARRMFDLSALQNVVEEMFRETRWLRILGSVIFFWSVLVIPVTYWRFSDDWPTFAVIGSLFLLLIVQTSLLGKASKGRPQMRHDRFTRLLSTALFPPISIRAADWICQHKLQEFHPLTAFKTWESPELFEKIATQTWRQTRWPRGTSAESGSDDLQVKALEEFLDAQGLPAEKCDAAPLQQSGSESYCPRCHTQYASPASVCADCGGVKLVMFSK